MKAMQTLKHDRNASVFTGDMFQEWKQMAKFIN